MAASVGAEPHWGVSVRGWGRLTRLPASCAVGVCSRILQCKGMAHPCILVVVHGGIEVRTHEAPLPLHGLGTGVCAGWGGGALPPPRTLANGFRGAPAP